MSPDPVIGAPGQLTVIHALAAVAEDVRTVRKDSRNLSQKFNFRGIDAVTNAVGPAFRKHGVICLPVTEALHHETVPLSEDRTANRCVVKVRYVFHVPAGDTLEAVVYGEAFDMYDKATAKAYSVAYRTCLLQTLTIPTDDPDPDGESYERSTEPQHRPRTVSKETTEKVARVTEFRKHPAFGEAFTEWAREQFKGRAPAQLTGIQLKKAIGKIEEMLATGEVPDPDAAYDEPDDGPEPVEQHAFRSVDGIHCLRCDVPADHPLHYQPGEEPFTT